MYDAASNVNSKLSEFILTATSSNLKGIIQDLPLIDMNQSDHVIWGRTGSTKFFCTAAKEDSRVHGDRVICDAPNSGLG